MKNILWVVCWLSLLVSLSSKSEEITTENLLGESTNTNVNDVATSGSDYGMTGADVTTGNQSLGGGSVVYDIDLSTYENIDLIKYGSTVYSHSSNSTVPSCNNTTGDCKDEFKITVNLYNDSILVKTYTHNYYDITWTGSQSFDFSQTTVDLVFNSAELELYGMDAGYTGGYYGPGFSDPYFTATYEIIDVIIDQILTSVELDFIDATIDIYEDFTVDIQFEDIQGDMLTVQFDMATPDVIDVQMDVPIVEEISVDIEMVDMNMTDMVEELDVQVAEVQSDSEDAPKSTVEAEEKEEQETVQPKDTKETIAAKILERVAEQGDQVALSNVKLAVMSQLTDTQEFENYQSKTIIDNNVDDYLLVTIDDPYGIMFSIAQDQLMESMVNQQYGRN